ncbi:putative leucine-rich repeat-containing protein DDB_G0290503 [Onthophagus taurus]|uniref:putative leucine-rich repeat-containing protein DDB_G0290503 n=1 Tax=Onthophagus taurus TaxID=166361 RepID=UPI0039BE0B4C
MSEKQGRGRALTRESSDEREESTSQTRDRCRIIAKEVSGEKERQRPIVEETSSGDDKGKGEEGGIAEMLKQFMGKIEGNMGKMEENREKDKLELASLLEKNREKDKLELISLLEENQMRFANILNDKLTEKLEENQRKTDEKLAEHQEKINGSLNQFYQVQQKFNSNINDLEIKQAKTEARVEENRGHLENLAGQIIEDKNEISKIRQLMTHNSESIGKVESHVTEMEGNFIKENQNLKGKFEEWGQGNSEEFLKLKREIENIRRTGVSSMSYENCRQLYKIKPELWPKFKGNGDKIHPMTYLNNLVQLTQEMDDQRMILTMIRLTLEERALEWYEMVSDRCNDLEDFKREFKNQFWNRKQQDYQQVRLLTGKYNERRGTRETYACDLYNRSKHIENINESEIAQHILNHFILSDNQSIICQNVKNMDELTEILRRLDYLTEVQNRDRINKGNQNDRYNQGYRGPNNHNFNTQNSSHQNNNPRPYQGQNNNSNYYQPRFQPNNNRFRPPMYHARGGINGNNTPNWRYQYPNQSQTWNQKEGSPPRRDENQCQNEEKKTPNY